ncbi:uncharacterized protein LOC110884112 [Helianthus annuus]|uniref:uncharacterized protein LOC110884112 n=1 Tax=Helianthus annuus TaxID=4232 RepID=UPI000B8F456D|nr:uncharacterized protein LOC110884112 [Helianthus annuus]
MEREGTSRKEKKVWQVKEDRKETGEEENPWTDVLVRGGNQYTSEKATTFYVTNLPEWTTGRDLWVECQPCGVICDAVVPKRRDYAGRVFGFVRFKRIKDQNKLLQALNNVWIGNKKIKVNVSKFLKEQKKEDKGKKGQYYEGPGYNTKGRGETENRQLKDNYGKENKSYKPINFNKEQVSYMDILTGNKKYEGLGKKIQFSGEETELSKVLKKRSLIAEVRDMERLKTLGEALQEIFPNTMDIRYLGGVKFLITFGSQAEAEDFRISFKESQEELFSEVWEWKGEPINFERLAWIKVVGIPIMLWSR